MPASERQSSFKAIAFVPYCIVTLIIVASFLFVHLLGLGFFFFTPNGLAFSTLPFHFPVFVFFFFGDYSPFFRAGDVFSVLWVIYAVCFAAAWRWRQGFHVVLKRALSGSRDVFGSFLFSMPLLSSMALTAALAIIYSQSAFGVGTGEPPLPSNAHEAFLQLAISPLVEELGFRIVPVGLIVAIFVFVASRSLKTSSWGGSRLKLFLWAFVYPEGAKKMAGLPTVGERGLLKGLSSLEWFIVVVSACVFGLTHVLSPGWEIGKITSASVQGFFFAVTYIAYGFEAPILLHWYFNYYFYFFDRVSESYFPGAVNLLRGVELLILVLGVSGWVFFVWKGLRRLLRKQGKTYEQPTVSPLTSPS